MSIRKLLKLSPFVLLTVFNLMATFAHAEGGTSGGGGDASEIRVDEIRADILRWIRQGGAENLRLPDTLTAQGYQDRMVQILGPHHVVVNFVTSAQEALAAARNQVSVNGQAKTCRSFISQEDRLPHILCNTERFAGMSESDQYRLVHHEFAGLAQVEHNVGAASDYAISAQLTDYLVPEVVLRLSVKKKAQQAHLDGSAVEQMFFDLAGNYKKIGGDFKCPVSLDLQSEAADEFFPARLKIQSKGGVSAAGAVDYTLVEGSYLKNYSYSSFYSAYSRERISTRIDPKTNYILYEKVTQTSDYPGILRWVETPNWFRYSVYLKKLPDGSLHLARGSDLSGGVVDTIYGMNCKYQRK